MSQRRVAFFDLDKTLLAVNSATLWVAYALKHKYLKRREALRALGWLVGYRFGAADLEIPIRKSIMTLAGEETAELSLRLEKFFCTKLKSQIRAGALAALNKHRLLGDKIVLLTSGSHLLAEKFVPYLGLDAIIATQFVTDAQGTLTGFPVEPLCFGPGKLFWAEAFARAEAIELKDCTFYTDAMADAPVMEAVGHPVAINPDPRLRRLARQRGWAIENWGKAIPEQALTRTLIRERPAVHE